MLKELLLAGNTREGKDLQGQTQAIKKMVIGTYILIITLHVNGLNDPSKEMDWLSISFDWSI